MAAARHEGWKGLGQTWWRLARFLIVRSGDQEEMRMDAHFRHYGGMDAS